MVTKNRGELTSERLTSFQNSQQLDSKTSAQDNEHAVSRISMRIPPNHRGKPIISHLISHYSIMVNIRAAVVRANSGDDGWFDLELWGKNADIQNALEYLYELEPEVYLEFWFESNHQEDSACSGYFKPLSVMRNGVTSKANTLTQTRIKIQIPSLYQQQPVISQLIADYGLTVNITGALLESSNQAHGLFDLALHGTPQQIQDALAFLQKLDVKIWGKPNPAGDSW